MRDQIPCDIAGCDEPSTHRMDWPQPRVDKLWLCDDHTDYYKSIAGEHMSSLLDI